MGELHAKLNVDSAIRVRRLGTKWNWQHSLAGLVQATQRHRRGGRRRGREGLAAVPASGGRARAGLEPTHPATRQRHSDAGVEGAGGSGGHGRASRSTTPSEARVWRSRGRPGPTAPGTPAAPQATTRGADGSRAGRRPRAQPAARPHKTQAAPGTPAARAKRPYSPPPGSGRPV